MSKQTDICKNVIHTENPHSFLAKGWIGISSYKPIFNPHAFNSGSIVIAASFASHI